MSDQKKNKNEDSEDIQELNDTELERVNGGAGLTYSREKLKSTSKDMGDFSLTARDTLPLPPTGLKIP
jgi:hypothetical protein